MSVDEWRRWGHRRVRSGQGLSQGVAEEIVSRYVDGTLELIAPQIILVEIPTAIQLAVRRKRLDVETGRQAIADFFRLQLSVIGDLGTMQSLIEAAYELAATKGCLLPDALYLIVAEESGCRLVTADRKLYNAVRDTTPYITWIADFPSARPA